MLNIILASKSKVRKEILDNHNVLCNVEASNVDEEPIKESLLKEGASPEIISKSLAELKANKVSQKMNNSLVLGADSVIDLTGELISKPESRGEALKILKKLNGKKHSLISSVCISKNGSMVWNYTDKAYLTMKHFSENELIDYLDKISVQSVILLDDSDSFYFLKKKINVVHFDTLPMIKKMNDIYMKSLVIECLLK